VLGATSSVRVLMDRELRRGDACAKHAIRVDVRARGEQAAKGALELCERQTGVDERADRHVAGDAGEAIEIQNPHGA